MRPLPMHSLSGRPCGSPEHTLSRRAFLGGAGGLFGAAGLDFLGAPLLADELRRQDRRVILLFLSGGASQFETWDPKPGRPTRGPFQAIPTPLPGYRVCELMPRMAAPVHRTAVIRSFSPPNVNHTGPGVEALLGGDRQDTPGLRMPTLGCLLAHELSRPGSVVPDHVGLYTSTQGFLGDDQRDNAQFLGAR